MPREDLERKIKQVESEIKAKNEGRLPDKPKGLSEQIQEMIKVVPQTPTSSVRGVPSADKYLTKKRCEQLKGIASSSEQISILVSVCMQEF